MEWPGWLLALIYLSCTLLLMLVVEIVHLLIIRPVAAKVVSLASRAARLLVAALTAKPHNYVLTVNTGELLVVGSSVRVQLGPPNPPA